ncbi:MAG: PASTA domain-containing protein [Acidimicrobiaceae bacterium]|nr:PASTA domain-containing protein [Acidimicrobiaceae bacterium]MYI59346.1 PASTA domain-containing protein [Acidimicrobiaceae bacterium]
MPDVVGLSGDEAFARLEDAGFYVEFDAYDTPRNGVQLDTVTGMEPIAGTRVPFGSTVTLSIFAEPVRVPDVVGLSSDEALAQLEAARFYVIFYAHDTPKTGVQHDTVTSMEPIAGTQVPFGSTVTLSIYTDNSTGDEPVMTEEDWERVRIQGEVNTEFGDRRGPSSWDETTATLNFQIADLSTGDIDRLQSRYADEAFTVTFSNATVSSGELDALKEPTGDLVRDYFDECAAYPSTYGIGVNVVDWAVSVSFSLTEAEGYSIDECINDMKQAVLANAADFAKEHSIDADPADLVIFHESGQMGPEDPP